MSELRAPVFRRYQQAFPEIVPSQPMVITISAALCELIADVNRRYSTAELGVLAPAPFQEGFIEWDHRPDIDTIGPVAMSVMGERDGVPAEAWVWCDKEGLVTIGAFAMKENRLVSDRAHPNFGAIAETVAGWESRDESGELLCDGQAELWGDWWVATCAVLAAPGVRSVDERVRDKALRVSPVQTAPLVTYRCIDIDIDKLAGIPPSGNGPQSGGGRYGGVALHHVRGHLRLTEKGLVPVRAHWRGDPAHGTRLRDHNIMRNEEIR